MVLDGLVLGRYHCFHRLLLFVITTTAGIYSNNIVVTCHQLQWYLVQRQTLRRYSLIKNLRKNRPLRYFLLALWQCNKYARKNFQIIRIRVCTIPLLNDFRPKTWLLPKHTIYTIWLWLIQSLFSPIFNQHCNIYGIFNLQILAMSIHILHYAKLK